MRSNSKLLMLAALFIMALVLAPVFAGAQVDTTVTATADKQFVKPGDSFTVTFSLTNAVNMYNYQIDLPLGSLVTAANEDAPPWVEGSLFEGKATQSPQNYLDKTNFPVPTAVLARSLQGDDFLTFTDTRVIGSITLTAGVNDGVFTVPLKNVTNQTEAESAIVRFDNKTLENKILYNAQPLEVIIDGTPPVINLNATPVEVNEEQAGTNVVTISGTVQEDNLDTLKVNGQLAALNGNGFSCNVSLQDGDNVINVVATDKAGNSSSVQRNITFIASKPAAPTADPEPGIYAVGVWVRLSVTTVGAQIYYTTNGDTPTEGSTLYDADKITVTSNTTIKAIAVKDGKTSDVATFAYTIDPTGIGDDSLNQVANELVKLYNNMDASDKAALETAKARINAVPEQDWEQLLAPVLDGLTTEAKEALGPDPCASLRYFILDGLNIYYTPNTNAEQVAQQLKIFRSTYKPMITGVFDGDITVEDIWNFILAVQDAVPGQFTDQDLEDLLDKGFDIIADRLQEWLNGAIDETLNNPEYQVFKDKLAGVGLTRDILIRTKDNLFNAAEPDLSAEQAVVKAYVRSRVELVGKTTLVADTTETYQLKALGINLASLLKWYSSNFDVADFTQGSTLKAKTAGTTTVTAYWNTPDGLNKAWLKKFDVKIQKDGAAEIIGPDEGGVIEAYDGGVVVDIPAGALDKDTTITIEKASTAEPPNFKLVGFALEFGPDGLVFNIPIKITLKYDRNKLPGGVSEDSLKIYWFNKTDEKWEPLVSEVDKTKQEVSAMVDHFTLFALMGAVGVVPSPGGGGGGGGPAPAPGVGPEGGKVTGPAGKAVVEIPAGALDKKVVITIKQIAPADVTAPPATLKLAGDIYEFGPAGTKFAKPVTITLQYDPAKLAGAKEETLAIYYLDETAKTWVSLGGTVDKTKHTVTIKVDHFSKYAVMVETVAKPPVVKFKDVDSTHWAWKDIEALVAKDIIKGYPDQTFRPANNITRAEFATLAVRALGLTVEKPGVPTFADVSAGAWSYGYVEAAAKAGLVKGYDGKFRPNDQITRQEMAAVLVRAMGKEDEAQAKMGEKLTFADAGKIAAWAKGYVAVAAAQVLIEGYPDQTFGPQKNATRAETAAMVYRFLEKASK